MFCSDRSCRASNRNTASMHQGRVVPRRQAGPRTTMRHDRARNNPGRHPAYILAAYLASGT